MSLQDSLISRGKWYYTVTILTCGMFAWVPFVHASTRLTGRGLGRMAIAFGAAGAIAMLLIGTAPTDSTGTPTGVLSNIGAVIALGIMIFACVKLSSIRHEVYPAHNGPRQGPAVDPSIQNALAGREYRARARKIVDTDVALARDLRIGRPDLERDYLDGGLVDLNNAPSHVMAHYCGIPDEAAQRIATQRALYSEGFSSVEEAIVVSNQTATHAEFLRDRGVVLPR